MTIAELKAKADEIVESIKDKGIYWKENTLIIRKTKKPFFQNEIEKSDREKSKTKTSGFPTHAQKAQK